MNMGDDNDGIILTYKLANMILNLKKSYVWLDDGAPGIRRLIF